MRQIRGCRVLIAEDDFLLADDLAAHFRTAGAAVLGPYSSLDLAWANALLADVAVLDVNLRGIAVFPLADLFDAAGIPFVFYTGYDIDVIPSRFRHVGCLTKPFLPDQLPLLQPVPPADTAEAVLAMLPKLRLTARLMLNDAAAADRLVAATLERAIAAVDRRPPDLGLGIWLNRLMHEVLQLRGAALMN